jgi:hypothetical protein
MRCESIEARPRTHPKAKQPDLTLARRAWLRMMMQLALVGAFSVAAIGCRKREVMSCSDPASLTDAEISLRVSLHYSESSAQSDKVCARCAFSEASVDGKCRACKLLKGPVNPMGHCDSWSRAGT